MWDTIFPTHDITGAITGPYEKKCSTLNGSTPPNKLRSLSILGSGNTTRSDLITHWTMTPPAPETSLEKTKISGTEKWG